MKTPFIRFSLAASLAFGIPVSLQAATFTPNVFDDPAPNAAPNGCTNAGPNPTRCSLREASLEANASAGADIIILGEGTYTLSITEAGSPLSGDLDFVEGVDFGVTIQGQGSDNTTILAAPSLGERIMEVTGGFVNMTLQGLTFEGGNTTGDGGAVNFSTTQSIPSAFNILDCNFTNNKANDDGGAVYLSTGHPLVVIDGGTYQGNIAQDTGGALYLGHGGNALLIDSLKNLIFKGNQAVTGDGGAVFQSSSGGISLTAVQVIENNSAGGAGGGLSIGNGGIPLGLEIIDSVISNNTAETGGGGGVTLNSSGLARVVNSTISGNRALSNSDGGGAFISNGGGIQILGSTISGNEAETGGGLFYDGVSASINEITNSTFSGNEATGLGGGMYLEVPANFPISNVTIAGNSATTGGGFYAFGPQPSVQNNILTDNESSDGSDDCGSSIVSNGYNIFASPGNANCKPNGIAVGTSPNDSTEDPKIGTLADNGGLTLTYALLIDSPALNGGNPAGCEDGNGDPLTTDQRGAPRPAGAECDIGAVETSVSDLAIVKTADDSAYFVGDEITYTLTVTNNGPDAATSLVQDDLPAAVSIVSIDPGCTDNSGVITCDLGTVEAGESVAVVIVVMANAEGTVDNTATVSGADIDTDPVNNSSTISVDVLSDDNGGGGGCRIGHSKGWGSPLTWGLFAAALSAAGLLGRRRLQSLK